MTNYRLIAHQAIPTSNINTRFYIKQKIEQIATELWQSPMVLTVRHFSTNNNVSFVD